VAQVSEDMAGERARYAEERAVLYKAAQLQGLEMQQIVDARELAVAEAVGLKGEVAGLEAAAREWMCAREVASAEVEGLKGEVVRWEDTCGRLKVECGVLTEQVEALRRESVDAATSSQVGCPLVCAVCVLCVGFVGVPGGGVCGCVLCVT